MSTFLAGDGSKFGMAVAALLVACVVLPFACVWAWDNFRDLLDGEPDEENGY